MQENSEQCEKLPASSDKCSGAAIMKCVGEKVLTTSIGSKFSSDKSKFPKVIGYALNS